MNPNSYIKQKKLTAQGLAKISLFFLALFLVLFLSNVPVYANDFSFPGIGIIIDGTDEPAEVVSALQVLFLISIIALAPSLLMLLTGFTRIIISLHFLRSAMGTQQMPPNQVMVGVALILTLYLMSPMFVEINENALRPLGNGEISVETAIERAMEPIGEFMRSQAREPDIALFIDLSGETFTTREEIPYRILIPAFILGELMRGFIIGFVVYLPFIVIDMVVASILMAMGMMMLPPAMISMPFKLLLFLLVGGWGYVIEFVMLSFR
jgi:flagellar biosynthetic protein FliP